MTTKYQCDRCGRIMDYEDDKMVIMNFGAGREGGTYEQNKMDDLCPMCYEEVRKFMTTGFPSKDKRPK
jgi:rubredoxin